MAMDCSDIEGLLEAATAITVYRDLLDKWLHGTETEDVLLGGVLVPTLRKLVATINERESQAAQEVVDEAAKTFGKLSTQFEQLAEDIRLKMAELRSMRAAAVTLEPDEDATAVYSSETGLLELGIPRGHVGPVGPAGPAGTVIAGWIDSGEPGRAVVQYFDAGTPGSRGGGPAPTV